jgi:DNA polymerase (family 10)
LDLKDDLVYRARKYGIKFSINTDAHTKEHLNQMKYGVAIARRGWLKKEDVINTFCLSDLLKWLER